MIERIRDRSGRSARNSQFSDARAPSAEGSGTNTSRSGKRAAGGDEIQNRFQTSLVPSLKLRGCLGKMIRATMTGRGFLSQSGSGSGHGGLWDERPPRGGLSSRACPVDAMSDRDVATVPVDAWTHVSEEVRILVRLKRLVWVIGSGQA